MSRRIKLNIKQFWRKFHVRGCEGLEAGSEVELSRTSTQKLAGCMWGRDVQSKSLNPIEDVKTDVYRHFPSVYLSVGYFVKNGWNSFVYGWQKPALIRTKCNQTKLPLQFKWLAVASLNKNNKKKTLEITYCFYPLHNCELVCNPKQIQTNEIPQIFSCDMTKYFLRYTSHSTHRW